MQDLIIGVAMLAFAGITTVSASEINKPVMVVVQPDFTAVQQDTTSKTPVKIDALPDAVKATLSSDKYKDWAPVAAFLIIDANKAEYYQVDVKKAEETASLKIGKDGVVI